jgi:hypothetical protein
MPLTDYPLCYAPGVNENDLCAIDALYALLSDVKSLSKELEADLGVSGAKLRALVSFMRRAQVPIASGGKGYWLASEPDGLDTTICHLEERVRTMRLVIDGLYHARLSLSGSEQHAMEFDDGS